MCAVSVIMDYARSRIPIDQWDQKSYDEFKTLIDRAKQFDLATNQPHCEDPQKQEWTKEVEERLKQLENKVTPA